MIKSFKKFMNLEAKFSQKTLNFKIKFSKN